VLTQVPDDSRIKCEALTPHPNPLPQGEKEPIRVIVEKFAIGGDATHLTGSDAEARTLRHSLRCVVDGRPVDLVHAHATGTKLNDPVELAAIDECVYPSVPHVYSHKGALGHSLGAAGLVSVVLNCMMHERGVIPPNVRTARPIQSRLPIANESVERQVRRSIAIAAGFGGPTAVVGLRTI
jgi:3-oxoacyl-(acyl-carrier-protein) synthase